MAPAPELFYLKKNFFFGWRNHRSPGYVCHPWLRPLLHPSCPISYCVTSALPSCCLSHLFSYFALHCSFKTLTTLTKQLSSGLRMSTSTHCGISMKSTCTPVARSHHPHTRCSFTIMALSLKSQKLEAVNGGKQTTKKRKNILWQHSSITMEKDMFSYLPAQ